MSVDNPIFQMCEGGKLSALQIISFKVADDFNKIEHQPLKSEVVERRASMLQEPQSVLHESRHGVADIARPHWPGLWWSV